jgi:hypothetical protein
MIFMGDRGTEQGHNPIAHDPVHGTLKAVDCLNHAFEHWVAELLDVFRVAVSKQLHRTLDIGEQHGDPFALALEGCPCGEDLIGKMLGSVTLGRGKAGIVRNRLQKMATLGAALRCGPHLNSALGTSAD